MGQPRKLGAVLLESLPLETTVTISKRRGNIMSKILGIDLGTTNSAMAVMEGSEPESHS